ncbi:hypothetical protein HPB47_014574 [Ixodes persulcatus]|uniref:Uncharacterized protein n=1 Tax=Ixodes persulcatus TaxID=34615 RepID=A0AC60QVN9_IXOPE|nr:hypothetical protein HPB47_014574 [Ixodes persulcatus]
MWPLKFAVLLLVAGLTLANSDEGWKNAKSIYEFSALDIDGNKVDFNKYRGHVTLIVNVACKCLLTQKHYKKLSALYHKYSESKGLRIMAFPANDFAKQEPWAEPEIKEFVKQFDVTFDMFSKISVNGDNAHPLWKYLKEKQPGFLFNAIKWNFTKFLVDKNGQPVKRYAPTDSFEVERSTNWANQGGRRCADDDGGLGFFSHSGDLATATEFQTDVVVELEGSERLGN